MKNEIERNSENVYISKEYVSITDRIIPKSDVILMHWHEYYEIEIIVSGAGKMIINDDGVDFKSGAVFFLTPIDFHSIDFTEDTRIFNISFNTECLEDVFIPDILMSMPPLAAFENIDNLLMLAEKLKNELSIQKRFSKKYISSIMNCILIEIYRQGNAQSKELSSPVQNAIQYIHKHFREDISLEDAAAAADMSCGYLSRIFHQTVGEGYKQYLNRLRLSYAAKLLEYTMLPVNEAAYCCGFNSPERFIKNFKAFYNITPLAYRKEKNK